MTTGTRETAEKGHYSTMELSVRSSTQPASGTGSSSGLPVAPCKSYLWRMYAHAFA